MRVMLLKDVYKLGRAGDVKKVADGYGRNYLLPMGLAVLATPGALKQTDRIRSAAAVERTRLNEELGVIAQKLEGLKLIFPVKASETGRLYGSITPTMVIEAAEKATGVKLERRQIDNQPIKMLGLHSTRVRLTIDLVPEITLLVHREGEPPESAEAFVAPAEEPVSTLEKLAYEVPAEGEEATPPQPGEEGTQAEQASDTPAV